MSKTQMKLDKRPDGWWVVNVPDTVTECGPYDTRVEAEETRRGLTHTFKRLDDGTFGRND